MLIENRKFHQKERNLWYKKQQKLDFESSILENLQMK